MIFVVHIENVDLYKNQISELLDQETLEVSTSASSLLHKPYL